MEKFRLPRKTKKRLKKTIWLYPADEKGNSLMAFPTKNQKDYNAYKRGELRDLLANAKNKSKSVNEFLNKVVEVDDNQLKIYISEIFAKEYQNLAYHTLIRAKRKEEAIIAYYNFINAYKLVEEGKDSYRNICCLSIDYALSLLSSSRKEQK